MIDITVSDEEDALPLSHHLVKHEPTSPPPSLDSPPPRLAPSTSTSSTFSSSSPSQRRPHPHPSSSHRGDDAGGEEKQQQPPVQDARIEQGHREQKEGKEEKEAAVEEAVELPYSAHFNGVSHHSLSVTLTGLRESAQGSVKVIVASSKLIDSVLVSLPAPLQERACALYERHYALEGRVQAEQCWALDRAKDMVVQGDIGLDTDWTAVMKEGWTEGAERRRQQQDDELRELQRRKALQQQRIQQAAADDAEGDEKVAAAPS